MTCRDLLVGFILLLGSAVACPAESAPKPSAPQGLQGEQAFSGRQAYVAEDGLRLCTPAKGFWVDLGAGKGEVALTLIERTGNPVLMIDPNADSLAKGLQTARDKGCPDRLLAVVGKAESLPLLDNSVDFLISRGSIFFWDDPVTGLQEIQRVLRPGGKAYLGGGTGSGYPQAEVAKLIESRKARLQGEDSEKWKRFVELRRPEQMRQWATAAGLRDFQVLGQGAIADDPQIGQGVWLTWQKPPEAAGKNE